MSLEIAVEARIAHQLRVGLRCAVPRLDGGGHAPNSVDADDARPAAIDTQCRWLAPGFGEPTDDQSRRRPPRNPGRDGDLTATRLDAGTRQATERLPDRPPPLARAPAPRARSASRRTKGLQKGLVACRPAAQLVRAHHVADEVVADATPYALQDRALPRQAATDSGRARSAIQLRHRPGPTAGPGRQAVRSPSSRWTGNRASVMRRAFASSFTAALDSPTLALSRVSSSGRSLELRSPHGHEKSANAPSRSGSP
jgi:hypothetical protein